MNPFANDDEPTTPDWFLPGKPRLLRQVAWWLRNPLHNFTHKMIGWEGQPFSVQYWWGYDFDKDGFADDGGWLGAKLTLGSSTRPWRSYRAEKWEAYFGWHPSRGKFGLACRRR